jgi:hypothetical protein
MFCRWLLTFATLTVLHAIASCVAFFFAYVAWESPGFGWLSDIIVWTFFFPFMLLGLAGMVDGPLDDSLANFAVNSVCWVAVVYPFWLMSHRPSRKFLLRRRVAVTDRPR